MITKAATRGGSRSHFCGHVSVQECEDLRRENKHLSNEIHMERVVMRTENELIMRNLRNMNQELQAQVKEVGGATTDPLDCDPDSAPLALMLRPQTKADFFCFHTS